MGKRYSCHKISEGKADGEALVSLDDIMFYLIKPETGVVIEPSHDLYGKSMDISKRKRFKCGSGRRAVSAK